MPISPLKRVKRFIVFVIGSTIVLLGLAMLVLPGPGIVAILAGLGVLGTEFLWAKRLLKKVRENSVDVGKRWWNGRPND